MTSMWGAPLRTRWRGSRRGDSDQAKFLTVDSLKWVLANKAYTPWYLVRYYRLAKFKMANPHVILRGMVFLGKNVEIHSTPDLSRLEIGRWVHIGDGNAIRCHEGSLRIGDKVVFGKDNVVNTYLDIEIGASTLVADWCYICDFDHRMDDINTPIKDQGIVKGPVRIGRTPGWQRRSPCCEIPASDAVVFSVRTPSSRETSRITASPSARPQRRSRTASPIGKPALPIVRSTSRHSRTSHARRLLRTLPTRRRRLSSRLVTTRLRYRTMG